MTDADATEAGLLLDICEHPHDDIPRLIYADWLEDHGQPERAEFIRVQLENADDDPEGARHDYDLPTLPKPKWRRERELWVHNGHRWFYQLFSRANVSCSLRFLRGGFIHKIECSCADWLAHGPTLVRQQPITEVRLVDVETITSLHGELPVFARWPAYFPWLALPGIGSWGTYASEQELLNAISLDTVGWARKQACLPPLPERTKKP